MRDPFSIHAMPFQYPFNSHLISVFLFNSQPCTRPEAGSFLSIAYLLSSPLPYPFLLLISCCYFPSPSLFVSFLSSSLLSPATSSPSTTHAPLPPSLSPFLPLSPSLYPSLSLPLSLPLSLSPSLSPFLSPSPSPSPSLPPSLPPPREEQTELNQLCRQKEEVEVAGRELNGKAAANKVHFHDVCFYTRPSILS